MKENKGNWNVPCLWIWWLNTDKKKKEEEERKRKKKRRDIEPIINQHHDKSVLGRK